MKKTLIISLCFNVFLFSGFALADDNEAGKALEGSMQGMMAGMHAPMTGDTDVDFVTMMIPHHQGAVDMCKVELQYGKDTEIRKLCEGIITAQETEIAQMKAWLEAHKK